MLRIAIAGPLTALVLASVATAQPAPAPANAAFYAECLAESAAAKSYDRNGGYLRFTCYGPAAQAFYDRLGSYSTPKGWVRAADARTYRFTAELKKDESGSGLDRCWKMDAPAADAPAYGCLLVFPVGKFLDD